MSTILLGRRRLIARACSGVATVAATSLFGSLVREAQGAVAPKRLVIYMTGSGLDETFYSENKVESETKFQFVGGFTPLERIKNDVIFMSKFYNNAHLDQHGNAMAALTCAKDLRGIQGYLDPRPGGPTFDFLLAQKSKATEPFPVVPLSMRAGDNVMHERCASGIDRVAPLIQGPSWPMNACSARSRGAATSRRSRAAKRSSRAPSWQTPGSSLGSSRRVNGCASTSSPTRFRISMGA